jgi:5-methylcytosine-specific restriction endonuclease McrA
MVEQSSCATCGVLFVPRTSGGKPQIRCSEKCRRKVANATFTKKNAPVRTTECAECGGPVTQAEKGRPRRFCSQQCKARVGNRALRRRQLPIRDPNPQERSCAYCGKPFVPRRKDQIYCPAGPGSYCIQKAYWARRDAGEPLRQVEQVKTCVECGVEFTAHKSNAKWCSKICRIRTTGRDASRRRGPVRPGWKPYTDREIFERDGWVCQICYELVDREARRTHRDGATIDHTIPLSRGGADSPENVVTAHWHCNRDKGNRTEE